MPRAKKGLNVPELVALLDRPDFCAEARGVQQEAVRQHQAHPSPQEWEREWPEFVERVVAPFVRKWGALPPPSLELVDPDRPRKLAFAIVTGRWGLIPVFPWTTSKEIEQRARTIHRRVGKVHADAKTRRLARIADWLRLHVNPGGKLPPRSEIAAAVWGRKKGLRRPTKAQAIRRLPFEQEQELLRCYQAQGLPWKEAKRRVYRRARGSESHAAAMVRMAEKRYAREHREFMANLEHPRKADPLGYALTALLDEIDSGRGDLETIHRKAADLRAALIPPSRIR